MLRYLYADELERFPKLAASMFRDRPTSSAPGWGGRSRSTRTGSSATSMIF